MVRLPLRSLDEDLHPLHRGKKEALSIASYWVHFMSLVLPSTILIFLKLSLMLFPIWETWEEMLLSCQLLVMMVHQLMSISILDNLLPNKQQILKLTFVLV